jgi:hypothetical protein
MRGKIVLAIIFTFAILYGAYSVWYVSSLSPVDQRFNLNKQAVTTSIPEPALLPSNIGDFKRTALTPVAPDAQNQRLGSAEYEIPTGGTLRLTVSTVADPAKAAHDWPASVDVLPGCAAQWRNVVAHPEAKTPYAYGTCTAENNRYDEFVWLNNNWLIRVSAPNSGDLLQFANNYPF